MGGGTRPPPEVVANIPIRVRIQGGAVDARALADAVARRVDAQVLRAHGALGDGPVAARTTVQINFNGRQPDAAERELITRAVHQGLLRATFPQVVSQRQRGAPHQPAPKVKTPPTRSAGEGWPLFAEPGSAAFNDALLGALADAYPTTTWPPVYGILYRTTAHGPLRLELVANRRLIRGWEVRQAEYEGASERPVHLESAAYGLALSIEPRGNQRYRELAIASVERRHRNAATQLDPSPPGDSSGAQVDATAVVDRFMAGWEETVGAYYWLGRGGREAMLLPLGIESTRALGAISHLPVVALARSLTAGEADELADSFPGGGADVRALLPLPIAASPSGGVAGAAEPEPPAQERKSEPVDERTRALFTGVPSTSPGPSGDPFEGEPSIDHLGAAGQMRALIAEIAQRLDLPPCAYAGRFCISAATLLLERSTQVESRVQTSIGQEHGGDAASGLEVTPSVATDYLRHLAGTVPKLRQLIELVRGQLSPPLVHLSWQAHWETEVFVVRLEPAIESIILAANQAVLAQLLVSSLTAIRQRVGLMADYSTVFEVLVRVQLADQVELIMLRDSLQRFIGAVGDLHGKDAYLATRLNAQLEIGRLSFFSGSIDPQDRAALDKSSDQDLVLRLADRTEYVFGRAHEAAREAGKPAESARAGEVIETPGGWAIRGSDGALLTVDKLTRLIAMGQQMVVQIDPLLGQLLHDFVPQIRPLVEKPGGIRAFLEGLLEEMRRTNVKVASANAADPRYAFDHGQILELPRSDRAAATVHGSAFHLSGTHLIAHQLVGEAFLDDPTYRYALDSLLKTRLGWQELKGDLVYFGSVAVGLICPPLGAAFAIGGGLITGFQDYQRAKEQEEIYGALMEPDAVLDYAQVQVEMFIAKLGIALSAVAALPEAAAALRGLSGAAKAGLRGEATRFAAKAIETQLTAAKEVFAKNIGVQFAKELLVQKVVGELIEGALSPLIDVEIARIQDEIQRERGN